MNERPLNERPAAKPIKPKKAPEIQETLAPVEKGSLLARSGCFGIFIALFLILFGYSAVTVIVRGVQAEIRDSSSGSETYDVSNPDPRLSFPISDECDAAMAASAADPSERGEALLVETGNICKSRAEWEAALWRYPAAIGGSSTAYLDGTEFDLVCSNDPELYICRNPE